MMGRTEKEKKKNGRTAVEREAGTTTVSDNTNDLKDPKIGLGWRTKSKPRNRRKR